MLLVLLIYALIPVPASFTGSAIEKVSSPEVYVDDGATLVINVESDFSPGETLFIDGIKFGSFGTVSSTTSQLALHTDGDSIGDPANLSFETIKLTGALTASNHDAGQASNQFSFQNRTSVPLFNFKLTPTGESATITDAVITLSGIDKIDATNIGNFDLYRDNNSDGAIDGGDTLIDGSGILTINGQHGAITFSTDFLSTTTHNYIMIGDTTSISQGSSVVFSINTTSFTNIGLTSGFALYPINTTSNIQHLRNGSSGGGSSQIGGTPPPGASVETGGGSGTGGETGQGTDGANIAPDPDYYKPTGLGADNDWADPTNAYNSDGVYAFASFNNSKQSYTNFGFNVPSENTIQGLAVKLDASLDNPGEGSGAIDVAISWDGGSSYTTAKATPTLTGSDVVYTVGGGTDTWGRSWTPVSSTVHLFRLRVTASKDMGPFAIQIDALEVRVYHQAGGGGAGGGGGI
ncbi:MAG: hypothetical protein R3B53_01970 [Candidatus Paceibacterota bacterium]